MACNAAGAGQSTIRDVLLFPQMRSLANRESQRKYEVEE